MEAQKDQCLTVAITATLTARTSDINGRLVMPGVALVIFVPYSCWGYSMFQRMIASFSSVTYCTNVLWQERHKRAPLLALEVRETSASASSPTSMSECPSVEFSQGVIVVIFIASIFVRVFFRAFLRFRMQKKATNDDSTAAAAIEIPMVADVSMPPRRCWADKLSCESTDGAAVYKVTINDNRAQCLLYVFFLLTITYCIQEIRNFTENKGKILSQLLPISASICLCLLTDAFSIGHST